MEGQIAEEAKSLSRVTVPEARNRSADTSQPDLAVNRNINQFQRLMRGHGTAKMRHTYTLVWRSTATYIFGGSAMPEIIYLLSLAMLDY